MPIQSSYSDILLHVIKVHSCITVYSSDYINIVPAAALRESARKFNKNVNGVS